MVRKLAHVSLAVFMVLALATLASAAPNVGSTSQKGSLLVFPKIVHYEGEAAGGFGPVDTYIFIGNDQTRQTYVKCYWMDNNQSTEDFHFPITANQPIYFTASGNHTQINPFADVYGPPFGANRSGSLVCWAQNDEDTAPVDFNHLYGYAMIVDKTTQVKTFYNATSFAIRGANFADSPGELKLEGDTRYDACPKYLITNFIPTGTNVFGFDAKPDLALWPCKQDLRQDRTPTCTKAKFDIWNGYEVKYTGTYQCFKCFFEGFLNEIGQPVTRGTSTSLKNNWNYSRGKGYGGEKFTRTVLGTDVARMRVQGVKSSVCYGNTKVPSEGVTCTNDQHVNTPLLGVLLYAEPYVAVGDATLTALSPVAGYTMFGASYDTSGFIKWDPAEAVGAAKK